jgi:polyvinyl alcohol dehydrogenase (cytochrome)
MLPSRWLRAGSAAGAVVAILALTAVAAAATPASTQGTAGRRASSAVPAHRAPGAPGAPGASTALDASPTGPSPADWPAYLEGPRHWSYASAQTAITPASVPDLTNKWHFAAGSDYEASPTVAGGAVFIGAPSGWFYKLSAATGQVLAKTFIGHQDGGVCGNWGVLDSATVAVNPANNQETVYVGSPNGYLYALSAATLAVEWKSVMALPDPPHHTYLDWSSPTVADGHVYIGVASYCNIPFIRGAVLGYNQETGAQTGAFYTVPAGDVGASVWSSVAVSPADYVYVTTANGPNDDPLLGYAESIVQLSPTTLAPLATYQVPQAQVTPDGDFGASPVLFGDYVGACNKNGIFYALSRKTMKLAWQATIGAASDAVPHANCDAAPVYNGKDLFLAGPEVTIGGTTYRGSVQERDPATGKVIWETGLPNGVIGSPTMDGAGVLAVGTYDHTSTPNYTYLINAATGKIIRTLVRGFDFGQSVFADNWLFTSNDDGVYAWGPLGHSGAAPRR